MQKEKLISIINDLKDVRTKTTSKVSDEILFQQGVDILITELISNNRREHKSFDTRTSSPDRPVPATLRLLEPSPKDNTPATPNQISALKKMGYSFDTSKLSKYEAWKLINGGKKSWKQN